jgi:hypothetical protein
MSPEQALSLILLALNPISYYLFRKYSFKVSTTVAVTSQPVLQRMRVGVESAPAVLFNLFPASVLIVTIILSNYKFLENLVRKNSSWYSKPTHSQCPRKVYKSFLSLGRSRMTFEFPLTSTRTSPGCET